MTAHDTALALAVDRRTFTPAEDPFLLDVADLLFLHRRNGVECGTTCTTWVAGTHEEHVTAELNRAGFLRDAGQIADLLNQIARMAGQVEQLTQSLAVATGHRHPFHPQETQ